MLKIILSLVFFLVGSSHLQAMTHPEQEQEESKPIVLITCSICHLSLSDTSKKNITFTCTTVNRTYQIHESCLPAQTAPSCPLCKKHTITIPNRHKDDDGDPNFWELIEKYKVIFPTLTLGVIFELLIR